MMRLKGTNLMNLSRDNHYVPQMYLKNWAVDEKVKVYDLLVSNEKVPFWRECNIKKTAYRTNLYMRVENGQETDDFEHWFDKFFESPATLPIYKICNDEKLTVNEWRALSDYIAAQYVRTLAFQQNSKELCLNIVPGILENLTNKIANLKSRPLLKGKEDEISKLLPLDFKIVDQDYDETHVLAEISTIIGKNSWLFFIKHLLENNGDFLKVMRNMKWSIVKSHPGVSWPTTDNPVAVCRQLGDRLVKSTGIINKGVMVMMPVNSHTVLIGKYRNRMDYKISANKHFSYAIKEMIVTNAWLQIYSDIEDEEVKELRPRVVDIDEFKRIREEYANWFDVYKEQEGLLL